MNKYKVTFVLLDGNRLDTIYESNQDKHDVVQAYEKLLNKWSNFVKINNSVFNKKNISHIFVEGIE